MFGLTPVRRNTLNETTRYGDFYNAIDNFFNDDFFTRPLFNAQAFKMDVKEDEKTYTLEAELPGINKEDITLDFNNGTLYIAVKHNEDINEEKDHYIHRERRSSSMQRGIYLGNIDVQGIDAKLEQGILHIIVPKSENQVQKPVIEIK